MPETQELTSQIYLTVGGAEVSKTDMQELVEVIVDQHVHLPDFFTLRLHDNELKLLDSGPFELTKEIQIQSTTTEETKVTLFKGEITAIEPVFKEGMNAELVVQGYDKSHRLFRNTRSKAYLNKKDSDLAKEIAQAAGLQADVEQTGTVYEHIFQHNQTDLSFLMQRAWRIGYECFVSDGKLHFRKPPSGAAALELTWGQELLSFQPRLTLAEQVDEVIVKGWDVEKKGAITGRASKGKLYPKIQEQKDGAAWAKAFGSGKLVVVDQPVLNQAEADALAAARLDELSGAFIQAEGVAFRRPDIKAGQIIEMKAVGKRFSGKYLVTSAQHIYNASGLRTTFSVRGARSGLLNEQSLQNPPLERWPGAVIAIVTNTDDPKKWGRVKIKFPWMADDAESNWARVLGIGAGPQAGFCTIPEVGDEVLVTFLHGDFSQPFVLGGLWNGQHKLPPEVESAADGEKPKVRTWRSPKGHRLTIHDNADNKIEITTAGGSKITLDDTNKKIAITSKGGQSIVIDDNGNKITVEGKSDINVNAGGNLKVQARGNLDLEASGNVNIKGTMINLN
jgi:phage protein D/phage baseplate assembly protein gpV